MSSELAALAVDRVAVIADRGFADAGLLEALLPAPSRTHVEIVALIDADPGVGEAEDAAQAALGLGAEAVLAIGGGSALCAAKAVAIRIANRAPLDSYEGANRLPKPPAPTIAVPTTAGSGSEVSTVTVLHDPGRSNHLVIFGDGYAPQVAILDGALLTSLPAAPLIDATLDALSHAYESLWARRSSLFTETLALRAAAVLRDALPGALERHPSALQRLIEASAMANLACGNSGMGLVHALTSAPSVHVAHGRQNGALLPHVYAFNRPALRPTITAVLDGLDTLYAQIGLTPGFSVGEVTADDAEAMIAAAEANAFAANNIRPAEPRDLRRILELAGAGA